MSKEITFTATRSNEDETTILIIKCEVSSQQKDAQSVVESIKKGLTNWVKETPEGKEVWEDSSKDLNFADLAFIDTNGTAGVFLQREGVFDFKIQVVEQIDDFTLDTVLVDKEIL
ncbi:MAG: hypothetical protein P8J32_04850 [bacterium]|nr:hypothetical protein [bacterium]